MNAESLARTTPMDRGIHRPGTASIDILAALRPTKHALRAGIARDHTCMIVIGVVRRISIVTKSPDWTESTGCKDRLK
jgi:hypothetical protein